MQKSSRPSYPARVSRLQAGWESTTPSALLIRRGSVATFTKRTRSLRAHDKFCRSAHESAPLLSPAPFSVGLQSLAGDIEENGSLHLSMREIWLRGRDLNPGPQGYEPCELPDCST